MSRKKKPWIVFSSLFAAVAVLWMAFDKLILPPQVDGIAKAPREVAGMWIGFGTKDAGIGLTLRVEGTGSALLILRDRPREFDVRWQLDDGAIRIHLSDRNGSQERIELEGDAYVQRLPLSVVRDDTGCLGDRATLVRKLGRPYSVEDVQKELDELREIQSLLKPGED